MSEQRRARPQLAHVAKAANVSISTASACLRDVPGPSDSTRERVKEIAAQLGYRTNLQAKALRDGQLSTVAFVFDPVILEGHPRAARLFWQRFVNAIISTLTDEGIALLMLPAESIESLRGAAIDAVILAALPEEATASRRVGFGIPVVAAGTPRPGVVASCYAGHDVETMHRIGLDLLREGGAQRIALIPNISLERVSYESSVYRNWCDENNMEATVIELDSVHDTEVAKSVIESAVESGVDAFLIRNGDAQVVLAGIAQSGRRVPEDVQIVSESEGTIDSLTHPPVTTVSLMGRESGRIIGEEVIHQIRNPKLVSTKRPRHLSLPYELTIRESTRVTSAADA